MVESVQVLDNNLIWDQPPNTCSLVEYVVEVALINIDNCEKTSVPISNATLKSTNMTLPELADFSSYRVTIRYRTIERYSTINYSNGRAYTTEFTTKESGNDKSISKGSQLFFFFFFFFFFPNLGCAVTLNSNFAILKFTIKVKKYLSL